MNRQAMKLWACLLPALLLGACAAPPERAEEPPARELPEAPGPVAEAAPAPRALFETPEQPARPVSETGFETYAGSGEFFDQASARRSPAAEAGEGEIIFNFEGEALQEVIKAILGDLLQENYVIAPGIQGNVTFSTSRPVAMDQVMPILEMLLSWNNASLVFIDGRYHVMPTARAIQGQLRPVIGPGRDQRGYEVRVFPLEYIAPSEMQKLLQPYAKENAFVAVDNTRGLLTLAGTPRELRTYQETIDIFDVDWLDGMSVGVYPLRQVEADTVVSELESVFGEGSGTPLAGMFRFLAIERLNAIMVITPQPEYLDKAADWVERLDRGGNEAGTRLYVYDVRNVKAVDLADTLNDVFGGSSGGSRASDRRGSAQLAPGLDAGEITSINDPRRRAQQAQTETAETRPAGRQGDGAGLALVDGEEISITAVEESNSLLIRATAPQYEAVLGAIRRLDTVPLQVLVEARVLEVTLNDNLQYGVSWFFENGIPSDLGFGQKSLFGDDPQTGGSLSGTGGLSYTIVGTDVAAVVTALESQTDLRTISAPSMMVLNNREANINVGTQIPVNSPIFNVGTGQDIGQARVQFRDTGVTLNVTPRVNPGGMVFMEVQQEVSVPIGTADANGNVSVNQRRLNTEVAVQSGETVVLGGLISQDLQESRSGLPFLSRLPVLGGVFGNQGIDVARTELLVLITPTVVTNVAEAREVSREYRDKMRGLEPFDLEAMTIEKTRMRGNN